MSDNDFGNNGQSTSNGTDNRDSIHIRIEDNESRPFLNLDQMPSTGSSSGLHSMLNSTGRNGTAWRTSLNELRTLISTYGNFQYTSQSASSQTNDNNRSLHNNEEHFHGLTVSQDDSEASRFSNVHSPNENPHLPLPQRNDVYQNNFVSRVAETPSLNNSIHGQQNVNDTRQTSDFYGTNRPQRIPTTGIPTVRNARSEEENHANNVFSDVLMRVLGNFVRYLPFLVILFAKFIHDHLLGILDIVLLQSVIFIVNKSLCNQVSKLSDKNFGILLRDFGLIVAVVTFRILMTDSTPDPYGLVLSPPSDTVTIEITTSMRTPKPKNEEDSLTFKLLAEFLKSLDLKDPESLSEENTVTITKAISLGLLIYYVAVNDLILKMLTILTKIIVTMLPNKLLRHKQRAQVYAILEYISQFYRSLVPTRLWVIFLFQSYTGLETISGVIFSIFYVGAKSSEFASRGKVMHKAIANFVRNMGYERKPTKDELDAAGSICPICHDPYKTPIILTCNHVFCDDCVSQWFKREQTCPMCRAKVSEDPSWQDGSTTFFYQLC